MEAAQRVPANAGGGRVCWRFSLLFVLVLVVVAAVGGFFWWRHYQSTPAYALALLVDAAQRNDVAEFEKLINDDEIAKNMVASVSQKAAARYGLRAQQLSAATDRQHDAFAVAAVEANDSRRGSEGMQAFAAKSEPRPFILYRWCRRLMTVTTEGDTAKVKAPMADRTIEFTMRRDADGWKVTDVKDDVWSNESLIV